MNIVGIIPARGGSKGIPDKNIKLLAGKPLIRWSIEAAKESKKLTRTIVSTDSEKIADVARLCGADVPFLRPAEFSGDQAGAIGVMRHAVNYMKEHESFSADVIVYMQPTSPFRKEIHIDNAVCKLLDTGADVAVSVMEVPHNMLPESLMKLENNELLPLSTEAPLNRHEKRKLYARNGPAILAIRADYLLKNDYLYGGKVVPILMDRLSSTDIDTPDDLAFAEMIAKQYPFA